MACCAVPGCLNSKTNSEKSFFRLPKEKTLSAAWITRLKRADKLPLEIYVCEEHFGPECFDQRSELERQFFSQKPGTSSFN